MSSATAIHAAVSAARPERSRQVSEPRIGLESGKKEVPLNIDLSDLVLPKINDLHVDGLKASWFSRLFGKH